MLPLGAYAQPTPGDFSPSAREFGVCHWPTRPSPRPLPPPPPRDNAAPTPTPINNGPLNDLLGRGLAGFGRHLTGPRTIHVPSLRRTAATAAAAVAPGRGAAPTPASRRACANTLTPPYQEKPLKRSTQARPSAICRQSLGWKERGEAAAARRGPPRLSDDGGGNAVAIMADALLARSRDKRAATAALAPPSFFTRTNNDTHDLNLNHLSLSQKRTRAPRAQRATR